MANAPMIATANWVLDMLLPAARFGIKAPNAAIK
jgi:hypothetical protein